MSCPLKVFNKDMTLLTGRDARVLRLTSHMLMSRLYTRALLLDFKGSFGVLCRWSGYAYKSLTIAFWWFGGDTWPAWSNSSPVSLSSPPWWVGSSKTEVALHKHGLSGLLKQILDTGQRRKWEIQRTISLRWKQGFCQPAKKGVESLKAHGGQPIFWVILSQQGQAGREEIWRCKDSNKWGKPTWKSNSCLQKQELSLFQQVLANTLTFLRVWR